MKLLLKSAVFFLAFALNGAQILKVTSTIIENGTTIYSVYEARGADFMLDLESVNPYDVEPAMVEGNPRWVELHAVDPTPDINVIGKDQVRLYFTAFDKYQNRTQVGAAIHHRLSTSHENGYYMPLGAPLDLPLSDYDLTEPSLSQSANSTEPPVLFYSNFSHIFSCYMEQGLYYVGDVTVLAPLLAWEGGEMRSPRAAEHNGEYYLLYTAADGVTVGALRSSYHGGPYEKKPDPIGVVKDRNVNIRGMHNDHIYWGEDGWPYL